MGLKEASSSTAIPTSLTEVISTEALSKLGIAGSCNEKKDDSEIIRQFESGLEQWFNDETVTGGKEIAAERLRKASYPEIQNKLSLFSLKTQRHENLR